MFEFVGENQITFSKETANVLFGSFMTGLFNSSIKVTCIESDYKGVTIDFTEDIAEGKASKAKAPSTDPE